MICPQCKTERPDLELFCTKCGYQLQPNQINQPRPNQFNQSQPNQFNQPQHYPSSQVNNGKGASTGSLVCGIIGLISAYSGSINVGEMLNKETISSIAYMIGAYTVPVALSVVAIVMGCKAKKRGYRGGKATAGIIIGSIAAVIIGLKIFVSLILVLSGTM